MDNQKENNSEDKLFAQQFSSVKAFAFDEEVAHVFSDMIKRSVPGYETILKSIAMFCMQYAQKNSVIVDLGCSLGAVAITAAQATADKNCQVVAIDSSPSMLHRCQKIIAEKKLQKKIQTKEEDIANSDLTNASVVVSNFTLQFLPKKQRLAMVTKIFQSLNPGGIFILSEKFKSPDEKDEFLIKHYHAYKKINGYSNQEIQRKRQALKDVLVPDSIADIENRFIQAGFRRHYKWFHCFNFASFIAFKE